MLTIKKRENGKEMDRHIVCTAFDNHTGCSGQNKQDQAAKRRRLISPTKSRNSERTLHDFTVTDIDGNEFNLATLKGKKVLVVNVASRCGLTPSMRSCRNYTAPIRIRISQSSDSRQTTSTIRNPAPIRKSKSSAPVILA